jgi:multisubunit Na+/H+ antiporter MnhB subunit
MVRVRRLLLDGLRLLLVGVVGGVLVMTVLGLPRDPGGLTELAAENLEASGVEHPVTAVLLNFRAYDTLLEVGVLLLAVMGVLALGRVADFRAVASVRYFSLVLRTLAAFVTPLALLVAGYLLWLGTHSPGGAFQAGAIVAAAAVLLRLAGYRSIAATPGAVLRPLVLVGFATFLLVGVVVSIGARGFLEYPEGAAGVLIVVIETTVALSIGLTLAAMFVGATPPAREVSEEATAVEP